MKLGRALVALLCLLAFAQAARAWVYPEHRDIGVLAVAGLDAERRAALEALWQDARAGDEDRLCAQPADPAQPLAPSCIDWAALPALAGDHACSSAELLETVRASDWILEVVAIGGRLKGDLADIPVTATPAQSQAAASVFDDTRRRLADSASRARRINALRDSNARLQSADPEMVTRAAANNAHFLLARPGSEMDPVAYAELTLRPGVELNALGVFSWFHLSALQKAGRLARESLSPQERRALARAALFDEAFALHFLEDVFAAGHVAGTWGDAAQRMGTHDFYNENGLEVVTWAVRDRSVVLMGDAHMRPQDAELASTAVRISLQQVLDAATGGGRSSELPETPTARATPEVLDVCVTRTFPAREEGVRFQGSYRPSFKEALLPTPVPGLGPGLGSMPRYRSEVGGFVGLSAGIGGRRVNDGFEESQTEDGWVGGLDLAFRAGLGLEGALGESGDGLVFAEIGFKADGPSTNHFANDNVGALAGSLSAAIPARSGVSVRVRMPYYLVPLDLLFLSPMYFFARDAYTDIAVRASNGGLIPWQSGQATRVGRFQFVLGRELGVTWYGVGGESQFLAPGEPPSDLPRAIHFKSVYFEAPILEYRPYRAFSDRNSSTLLFQLFAGADVPRDAQLVGQPDAPAPEVDTVWTAGVRMNFDWRRYW